MIYDSYAWKRELRSKKRQITKNNTILDFEKNFDLAYHKVESAILYSAFIIRKLIESEKLSNEADEYWLTTKKYLPTKHIDRLHHWCDEDEYNWEKFATQNTEGKKICNQLIHSYVLRLVFEEEGAVIGFFVSSDYDRNKGLLEVSLEDWIKYMDMIIGDSVVEIDTHFDEKKADYIVTKKVKGIW